MRTIPEHYTNITREQAIEISVPLHRAVSGLMATMTRSNYRIEVLILILSVMTSGGLWVLLAAALPNIAAWFGAAFSSIVTGLATYQFTLGPKRRVSEVYTLYQEIGRELARLRGDPNFDCMHFWDKYKGFEFQLEKLENPAIQP